MRLLQRVNFSTLVLASLALGVATGLFFGELTAGLKIVGDIFIKLLQMTVLPYVMVSLIVGLGQLDYRGARNLAARAGTILIVLWAIAIAVVLLIPLAFPAWTSASLFSTSLAAPQQKLDLITLYVPSNPFRSLANNVVPAVVVFSIAVGLALIGIENKSRLLEMLETASAVLIKITQAVARATPIGVFAIAAAASGTISTSELERIQVFVATHVGLGLVLALWVLPGLVTVFTPLSLREIFRLIRDPLVTAFATGNLFIVLPQLSEVCKELLRHARLVNEENESRVDVLVPVTFNLPNVGRLLTMGFVLFAGWYSGTPVPPADYPAFAISGFVSFFANVFIGIPFLLDTFQIPADTFQLFLFTDAFTGRFGVLNGAMTTIVVALLGTCAMGGMAKLNKARLVRYLLGSVGLLAGVLVSVNLFFTHLVDAQFRKGEQFESLELLFEPVRTTAYDKPPLFTPLPDPRPSAIQRIRERGKIRVGYVPGRLPHSFVNTNGILVGFDIEMASQLARALDVELELVPVDLPTLVPQISQGYCDIVMSGIPITPELAKATAVSDPYLEETLAFLVLDHRRKQFSSWSRIEELETLRIGTRVSGYYSRQIRQWLPRAVLVGIPPLGEFLDQPDETVDAVLITAEAGSAWSLLHPRYSIAVPRPDPLAVPMAYVMAREDRQLLDFVNAWIKLKQNDRTIDQLYEYWILGKKVGQSEPRWSVIRNVLGWVD